MFWIVAQWTVHSGTAHFWLLSSTLSRLHFKTFIFVSSLNNPFICSIISRISFFYGIFVSFFTFYYFQWFDSVMKVCWRLLIRHKQTKKCLWTFKWVWIHYIIHIFQFKFSFWIVSCCLWLSPNDKLNHWTWLIDRELLRKVLLLINCMKKRLQLSQFSLIACFNSASRSNLFNLAKEEVNWHFCRSTF